MHTDQSCIPVMAPKPIRIMHVSIEYGAATLGGLGTVTTQMIDAQNRLIIDAAYKFSAKIITPFYTELYKNYTSLKLVTNINHLYNDEIVKSNIYSTKVGRTVHYMVEPTIKYEQLFKIKTTNQIHNDTHSTLIERIKYFNSATAAFVHYKESQKQKKLILLLHEWSVALVPKLLKDVHNNNFIKNIFVMHISIADSGLFTHKSLQGMGITFNPGEQMLKYLGIKQADKIVAVSPSFLHDTMTHESHSNLVESLRKILIVSELFENKVIGILNGFNFAQFCPIGTLIPDHNRIYESKQEIKRKLIYQLCAKVKTCKINLNLPIIFYIGRFSPEKGVDVFAQVIKHIKGRAIFFALGRGLTSSIKTIMRKHSQKSDNIFISNNATDQDEFGKQMRACADFYFVPSHREACGLVPMECFANGGLCITSGVEGLRDSTIEFDQNCQHYNHGNSFKYPDKPEGETNIEMLQTIDQALLFWQQRTVAEKNAINCRVMQEAKNFDWLAPQGALSKYVDVCEDILSKTTTGIRSTVLL